VITSTSNPRIAAAARLHRARHRRETGRTLLEGPLVVGEAIDAGFELEALFGLDDDVSRALAARAGVSMQWVAEPVLHRLAGTSSPRGPVAIVEVPPPSVPATGRLLAVWEVGDPGNCGTLLRSAAAFGYGFVAGPESADTWSPKTLRSGAGAQFRTSVGAVAALDDLGSRPLVATVPAGGTVPGPLPNDAVVLIGSEAHGLPSEVVERCDIRVTIPMPGGSESLNASVAGSIVAFVGMGTD